MGRFERLFGQWVVKQRWWLILATMLIVITAASGVRFLGFNNDMRVFFSKENPQLQALEALEGTYTKNENVFFVIAPGDGSVFNRENLAAIEELTEAAWKIPYSSRVDSITNFQHTRADGDDLIVEDLVFGADRLLDREVEDIKRIALNEPVLVNRLILTCPHSLYHLQS